MRYVLKHNPRGSYGLEMVEGVYSLLRVLPRLDHQTPRRRLPQNGIYVFFERGQTVQWRNRAIHRIVRVGTHRRDGRFRDRIRQHYGRVHSFRGNKNASVFRKHLGGALLRRADPQDTRLGDWLIQGGRSYSDVEEMVSRVLRENFTFCCFRVDTQDERLTLESGLIALLAQYPLGQPSANWLGKHAASEKVKCSGLWNTQRIDATPLTPKEFERLEQLVQATLAEVTV